MSRRCLAILRQQQVWLHEEELIDAAATTTRPAGDAEAGPVTSEQRPSDVAQSPLLHLKRRHKASVAVHERPPRHHCRRELADQVGTQGGSVHFARRQ